MFTLHFPQWVLGQQRRSVSTCVPAESLLDGEREQQPPPPPQPQPQDLPLPIGEQIEIVKFNLNLLTVLSTFPCSTTAGKSDKQRQRDHQLPPFDLGAIGYPALARIYGAVYLLSSSPMPPAGSYICLTDLRHMCSSHETSVVSLTLVKRVV